MDDPEKIRVHFSNLIHIEILTSHLPLGPSFFFFLALPYGSSWARDRTRATAATQATAVTTPDPQPTAPQGTFLGPSVI